MADAQLLILDAGYSILLREVGIWAPQGICALVRSPRDFRPLGIFDFASTLITSSRWVGIFDIVLC